MASFYSDRSNGYRLRLDITPGAQSIPNNTTAITWALFIENNSYNSMYHYSDVVVTIDGTQRYSVSGIQYTADVNPHQTVQISSGSFTATHGNDGSKSMSLSASFKVNQITNYTPQKTLTISDTITLATIPRATKPSISNVTLGQSTRINLPRASTSFVHKLTIQSYNTRNSTWTTWATVPDAVGAYYDTTLWTNMANDIPNATQGTWRVLVTTYNGSLSGTQIGSQQVASASYFLPASYAPTVSSASVTNHNATLQTKFGGLVKGQSRAKITVGSSNSYGATNRTTTVRVGGKAYTANLSSGSGTVTTDVLTLAAGTHASGISVTVTDSRGRSTTRSFPITVLNWFRPTISSLIAYRVSGVGGGHHASDGKVGYVNWTSRVASVAGKNTKAVKLDYKHPTTGSWVNVYSQGAIAVSSDMAVTEYAHTKEDEVSLDYTYQFRLTVSDYFATATQFVTIETSKSVMDFRANKQGLAIGKASEKNAFEVAWPAEFMGNLTNQGRGVISVQGQARAQVMLRGESICGDQGFAFVEYEGTFKTVPTVVASVAYGSGNTSLRIIVTVQPAIQRANFYLRNLDGTLPPAGIKVYWTAIGEAP